MLKMAYLKKKELENILCERVSYVKQTPTLCSIVITEEPNDEYIEVVYNSIVEKLYLEDLFDILSETIKLKIKSYDVMEIGDYGDGFVFFTE